MNRTYIGYALWYPHLSEYISYYVLFMKIVNE